MFKKHLLFSIVITSLVLAGCSKKTETSPVAEKPSASAGAPSDSVVPASSVVTPDMVLAPSGKPHPAPTRVTGSAVQGKTLAPGIEAMPRVVAPMPQVPGTEGKSAPELTPEQLAKLREKIVNK